MNQLEDLKMQRMDRLPPANGLERALAAGGRRRRRTQRIAVASLCAVAVVGVAIPVVWPSQSSDSSRISATPPPSVQSSALDPAAEALRQVTSIPATAFAQVGAGGLTRPSPISGTPLVYDGKPGIFWYGAEYSPFAAAQRWALVIALSRFGTWSALNTTISSATDVHPNTATFTFHGSRYSSPYLSFQSVESSTNQGTPLEALTAGQSALVSRYDETGSIPFIDFSNRSTLIGASYDMSVLDGASLGEIAAAANNPATTAGRAILGAANTMTAAICDATGAQPAAVCSTLPH
jgi:hypothetical protein